MSYRSRTTSLLLVAPVLVMCSMIRSTAAFSLLGRTCTSWKRQSRHSSHSSRSVGFGLTAARYRCFGSKQGGDSRLFVADKEGGIESSPRRRKRKRRKDVGDSSETATEVPSSSSKRNTQEPLKPREDAPVSLQVQNIRDVVSGKSAASPVSSSPVELPAESTEFEPAPGPAMPTLKSSANTGDSSATGKMDDSLQQLLADAKKMQALDDDPSSVRTSDAEEGFSIPKTFKSVLSTIVTIDFFVVCGFLLWFLAGIFCSYVLQNDTVQIAFNQQFQTFVQPALGILMIGSIAGSFGGDEEGEQ